MLIENYLGLPEPAAAHAAAIDQTIGLVHWLMLVLFVGWMGFFVYAVYRFRSSRNPRASYVGATSKTNTYLEIGVAVFEAVLLIGFSIPLWAERVGEPPPGEDAVVIRAVAQQFAWNFHYPGGDRQFGRTDIARIDEETNPIGLDRDDPAAKDDITTVNQLHVPVHRPVVLELTSKDVIHSFGVPHFRVKQDAVPGLSVPVWWVPTHTTEEMRQIEGDPDFTYEIACAQLCGLGHLRMRGFVTVHTAEAYQAWLDEQAAALVETAEGDFWE
jgi:cytochrome c oxidase subunit 2